MPRVLKKVDDRIVNRLFEQKDDWYMIKTYPGEFVVKEQKRT